MPRFKHIEKAERVAEKARIKQKKIKKRPLLGEGNTLWQRIRSAPHARGYTEFLFYCIFLFVLAFCRSTRHNFPRLFEYYLIAIPFDY